MKSKTKILLVIIFFILLIITQNNSYAASVNISCDTTMTTRETKTITVSGTAVQWNLTLYVDGVALASSTELENYEGNIAINFSAQYTPSSVGNKTIELKGSITEASDASTITSFPSKNISVTEPAPVTPTPEPTTPDPEPTTPTEPERPEPKSNIAILNNLGIKPYEYDFSGFSKNPSKEEWEVTVPSDITEIEVYATAGQKGRVISGKGIKKLVEGTNLFEIVVQSEDGTNKKTYTLKVTREIESVTSDDTEEIEDVTENANTMGLSKLEIKDRSFTPEFAVDTYRYTIQLEDEEQLTLEQIKELIITEVNFEGGTFEITGEENLDKDQNKVIISVKDAEGREIAIYTLVFRYSLFEDIEDDEEELNEITEIVEYKNKSIKLDKKIIVAISIIIITLVAITSTIISYKQRKILKENGLIRARRDYEEDDYYYDTEALRKSKQISSDEEGKSGHIEDIFEKNQVTFETDEKDYDKNRKGKGKHS